MNKLNPFPALRTLFPLFKNLFVTFGTILLTKPVNLFLKKIISTFFFFTFFFFFFFCLNYITKNHQIELFLDISALLSFISPEILLAKAFLILVFLSCC